MIDRDVQRTTREVRTAPNRTHHGQCWNGDQVYDVVVALARCDVVTQEERYQGASRRDDSVSYAGDCTPRYKTS